MLDIAKGIIKIRKELNLTQSKFAKLIGIEQPYLSKIESGKNIPTLETLSEIFSNLGYIMNVTVTKEENTVENKKSYPTSETLSLRFSVEDVESTYNIYYRHYYYDTKLLCNVYSIVKGGSFELLLEFLENVLSKKIPTKTPKKVLLYFSSEKSVCTLRFYTNSNQYKSSNYVDIDLEPVFFSDSDISHGLSIVKFSTEKKSISKRDFDELEETKEVVESIVNDKNDLILSDYIHYLERLRIDDWENHYDPLELNAKLVGVHILYFVVLGFSVEDVKRHYFEGCASLK